MALGGDPPDRTRPTAPGSWRHAVELVELARAIGGFSDRGGRPPGRPSGLVRTCGRPGPAGRQARLADFAVTQFFFEADEYGGLVADLAERGLDKPVLPGIMPVTSLGVDPPPGGDGGGRARAWMIDRLEAADARGGTTPSGRRASTSPPSCAGPCSTRARRGCTSTRSTGRPRPARSTGPWASPPSSPRPAELTGPPGAPLASPNGRLLRWVGFGRPVGGRSGRNPGR